MRHFGEIGERQTSFFYYRPQVEYRIKHRVDTRQGESGAAQLRTDYNRLNAILTIVPLLSYISNVGKSIWHYF